MSSLVVPVWHKSRQIAVYSVAEHARLILHTDVVAQIRGKGRGNIGCSCGGLPGPDRQKFLHKMQHEELQATLRTDFCACVGASCRGMLESMRKGPMTRHVAWNRSNHTNRCGRLAVRACSNAGCELEHVSILFMDRYGFRTLRWPE